MDAWDMCVGRETQVGGEHVCVVCVYAGNWKTVGMYTWEGEIII